MIDFDEVLRIFAEYTPPGVTVRLVEHEQYIKNARMNAFVQAQIDAGIYNEDTFGDEFLSPVVSYVVIREIGIDYTLLTRLMEGVSTALQRGYVHSLALHEAHHFQEHLTPSRDLGTQAHREIACEEYVKTVNPGIAALAAEAIQQSEAYQRVFNRINSLAS